MDGEGKLDKDASEKLEFLLRANPKHDASTIMSAAIRLWYVVAMERAAEILEEKQEPSSEATDQKVH